jgi:hypothetical protein
MTKSEFIQWCKERGLEAHYRGNEQRMVVTSKVPGRAASELRHNSLTVIKCPFKVVAK